VLRQSRNAEAPGKRIAQQAVNEKQRLPCARLQIASAAVGGTVHSDSVFFNCKVVLQFEVGSQCGV